MGRDDAAARRIWVRLDGVVGNNPRHLGQVTACMGCDAEKMDDVDDIPPNPALGLGRRCACRARRAAGRVRSRGKAVQVDISLTPC